jgi:YD repeat-containing protein
LLDRPTAAGALRAARLRSPLLTSGLGLLAAALLALVLLDGGAAPSAGASARSAVPMLAPPAHGRVARLLKDARLVPRLSTATSRTYRRADGTYVSRIFAAAPSFRDTRGTEHAIDASLHRAAGGGFRPAAAPVPATLPPSLAAPVRIDNDGAFFTMQLRGARGHAVAHGATVTYRRALPGTDVIYRSSTAQLGELLHLTGRDAAASYTFDLRASRGATLQRRRNGRIVIRRADGRLIVALAPSYAFRDGAGHHEQTVRTTVVRVGDGWRLTLALDRRWLSAALRRGPVTIDPTVELQGSVKECALSSDAPDQTFCGDEGGLWVGWNGDHDHHSLVKWDLSAIPADAIALWGDFGLYQASTGPANAKTLTMHRLTGDFTADASWNRADATNQWISPGGDYDPAPAATASVPSHHQGWVDWYATGLVQGWIEGVLPNYGVVFKDQDGPHVVGEEDFNGTPGTSPAAAPELDIMWSPRLGFARDATFDGLALDGKTGLGVNLASGNLLVQTRGLHKAGAGLDLDLTNYHNSLASPTDLQGEGIRGTATLGRDVRLKVLDPTTVVFSRGDGLQVPFLSPTTSGTTVTYAPPDELADATLTRTTNNQFSLHLPSGLPSWGGRDVTLAFGTDGRLLRLADAAGHTITLSYYSDGGPDNLPALKRIVDDTGASWTVTRNALNDAYIQDVADSAGHHWHYTYGHLDTDYVTAYAAGDTGETWHYDYDSRHRLVKVTTPDGVVTRVTYVGTGSTVASVMRTTDAAHTTGPTTQYAYAGAVAPCVPRLGDVGSTRKTTPDGRVTTYCHDTFDHITYDDSGPALSLGGDLYNSGITADSRQLFDVAFDAQARAGVNVAGVEVLVDGLSHDRFDGGACAGNCSRIADTWYLDTSELSEGWHRVEVAATGVDGRVTRRNWRVDVPGPIHYASALAVWRLQVQGQVDRASASPLTAPMEAPPDDWTHASTCETDDTALRACYDAIMSWGNRFQTWLADNLPDDSAAAQVPAPPRYAYSPSEDLSRDLTDQIGNAFTIAQHYVSDPNGTLDVAIGFHRPLTPSEVDAAIPAHATLQPTSALDGVYDPAGGGWGGTGTASTPSSLDTSIDDFYANESSIVQGDIAELQASTPSDQEEAEDISQALSDARAFQANLDARGGFVTGVTVRLGPAQAAQVMRTAVAGQSATNVQAIAPFAADSTSAAAGQAALGGMSVDAMTLADASEAHPTARAAAAGDPNPTCRDRGEEGRVSSSILQPNPVYWAPSRHQAWTDLERDTDGPHGLHRKDHHLRFRWQAAYGLAWMCASKNHNRNVEIEAKVYPDPDHRWSDNWESQNPHRYTVTNMPGAIAQDDIAIGDHFPVTAKSKYPDFSIIAKDSQSFRYRKLYFVDFKTNEGSEDAGEGASDTGTVIYSAQPSYRAHTTGENGYCLGRFLSYKSCMFTDEAACYRYGTIQPHGVVPANTHMAVDWGSLLGYKARLSDAARDHPDDISGNHVTHFCDPRPPHSDDT